MESIKELRKICQKPSDRHNPESLIDERIWRVFSIYLTKLLLYTPLKPNHVTMIMILWGFIVGFLFSIGNYWYMIAGAVVLGLLWPLDAVDGEMARYKKMPSLNGVFLDIIAHSTNVAVPFIGLTIGLYKLNPSIYIVIAGLLASAFSVFCLNVQSMKHHVMLRELIRHAQKIEQIKSKEIHKEKIKETMKETTLKSLGRTVNYLYHHIYMVQIIFLAAIFNKLHWVLLFYGLTFPLMWLIKVIHEYRTGYEPYEYLLEPYKK